MSRFMSAKFDCKCKETGKQIKKGENVCYVAGKGYHHKDSEVYKNYLESLATADHVQANEDAYFDNFCSRNNI